MKTIDQATVPPKMSKIERLMTSLDALSSIQSEVQPTISLGHIEQTAKDARQLILDLLGMSDKPPGEQIYARWLKEARSLDQEPPGLRNTLLFITAWNEDTFPANESGQIPFGRALREMAIDAIRAELKRQDMPARRPATTASETTWI